MRIKHRGERIKKLRHQRMACGLKFEVLHSEGV